MDVAPVYVMELTQSLLKFQKAGYLCDTAIVVDDGQLRAHSAVLAAASPLFKSALKVNASPVEHTVIMPGIQLSAAEVIVEYMYTGNFELEGQCIDCEQVNKLQQAIQEFGVNLQLATEDKYVSFYSKCSSVELTLTVKMVFLVTVPKREMPVTMVLVTD